MLNLSTALQTQIANPTQTLAWCWRIIREDGFVVRITSHDRNLVMDGTYLALAGYVPSAVDTELGWNSQNQNLQAILDTPAITEEDLDRGLYDFARIECFLVNYLDLPVTLTENPAKRVVVYKGILGKLTRSNIRYSFEARGFEYLLNNKIGSVTSKLCRARFGDSDCKVNASSYTYNLSVASVTSDRRFTLSPINLVIPPVNFFQLTSTRKTWTDAEAEAVGLGGHLATIRNQSQNDLIMALFGNLNEDLLWIGLYKDRDTEEFIWTSGEPVTYTNFGNTEPDYDNYVYEDNDGDYHYLKNGNYYRAYYDNDNETYYYIDDDDNYIDIGRNPKIIKISNSALNSLINGVPPFDLRIGLFLRPQRTSGGLFSGLFLQQSFEPGEWDNEIDSDLHYGIMELPGSGGSYTNAPDGWFNYGTVTFTSGLNAGAEREIASYASNTVTLFEKAPFTVSPGDTLTIVTGCDKTLRNCFRYNNVINFQGEPYIPTPDKFASTPIDAG